MPYIVDGPGLPPVPVPGIVIESRASQLQALAEAAQVAWFAAPNSREAKAEYALRLRHWAEHTSNPAALHHAQWLEKECADALLR